MSAAPQPIDYRPIDEINADLCDIRDRLNAVEAALYQPTAPTPIKSRERTLKDAEQALRRGIDAYIELGVIDNDVLTSIARHLVAERIAVAEREGRL